MGARLRQQVVIALVALVMAAPVSPIAATANIQLTDAEATPESEPLALTIEPTVPSDVGYVSIVAQPGVAQQTSVTFGVAQGEVEAVQVFKANARTLANGGFGAADAESEPTGTTTWIDFDNSTHRLEAGESIERSVTILVPEGTAPGEYVSSLGIQTADPIPIPGVETFDQNIRLLLPVLITVPGPLNSDIVIGQASLTATAGGVMFIVPVENSGNAIVRPTGEITFVDPGTDEFVLTAPVAMDSVYPGDETTLEIAIPPSVSEGDYEVNIDLADEENDWDGYETSLVLTAPDPEEALAPDPIVFNDVIVEIAPDEQNPQFANVSATITNNGEVVENVRLTLSVSRDGEPVEDYALIEPLTLPNGTTTVDQRYIPGTGWESGEYSFELVLENIESNSEVAVVVARFPVEGTITIP